MPLWEKRRDLPQEWVRMFELEQEEWEHWVAYYNLGALTVTLATFVLWFSTWNPDGSGLPHLDDLTWSVDSPGLELISIGS